MAASCGLQEAYVGEGMRELGMGVGRKKRCYEDHYIGRGGKAPWELYGDGWRAVQAHLRGGMPMVWS